MSWNHVVLIGSSTPATGATTFGTGFLVLASRRCWIVTCRHVIREAGGGALFALPQPRKTKNPRGGYYVLAVAQPRFHPSDTEAGTYDVAVAEVIDCDLAVLHANGIAPVELNAAKTRLTIQEGVRLKALGYPTDYASDALAANSDEPLLPKQLEGTARAIPLHLAAQFGFDVPLREALFAQTATTERGGKGMSGAIVCAVDDTSIAGIVLADGDFEYVNNSSVIERFGGFVFASVRRIIETLPS